MSVSLLESGNPPERHHELIEMVTSPETDFLHLFSRDQLQVSFHHQSVFKMINIVLTNGLHAGTHVF